MFGIFRLLTLFLRMVWDWTLYKWWTRPQQRLQKTQNAEKIEYFIPRQDKVVVITGATAGLGKALVCQMVEKNAIVFMACRNLEKAEKVKKEIIEGNPEAKLFVVELNLESMESVRKCAAQIKGQVDRVDVLINNAGCLGNPSLLERRTEEGLEKVMATNYFGHFLLTKLLLGHLGRSGNGRVICIGSTGSRFSRVNPTDLNFDVDSSLDFHGFRPYLNSKLCLMQFARHFPSRLSSQNKDEKSIRSFTLCPGFINSDLWVDSSVFGRAAAKLAHYLFGLTPDQAAETVMYCAISEGCSRESGRIYRFGSQIWTSLEQDSLFSSKTAELIWNSTERLLEKYAT